MKIEAEVFKVKQPSNSSHLVCFEVDGVKMQIGICIQDGEICGSGFVQKRRGL